MREHIGAALAEVGSGASEEDVNRILSELGSPGAVAEAALAERPTDNGHGISTAPDSPPAGAVATSRRERLLGRWVPPVVAIGLFILGALSLFPMGLLPLAVVVALFIASGLWTPLEKVLGAAVAPIGLASTTFYALTGRFELAPVLGLIALIILFILAIRGGRRAAQHARTVAATTTSGERA
ncbi:hypothetical protein [Ruania alba]|uniref:Uncharacterized protein n=1 Tax=Ruania alba TaxID=648782 RepID=A0A1H5CA80_9MICO|nr:hypothetical protein [Ruania alba]SED63703.1 hypothetical protein SAMN04488554_0319 [Ruania alba]